MIATFSLAASLAKAKQLGQSAAVRQSVLLAAAQGVGTVLSFLFTVIVTRALDVAHYGAFRYVMTYFAFAMTILQFGWPYSASRLLAVESGRIAQQEIVGSCILLLCFSTLAGVIGTVVVYWTGSFAGWKLPSILLWSAPFVYVALGQYMVSNICQGLNRISILSAQQVLPYILLLPLTALQVFGLKTYSVAAALIGYVTVFTIVLAAAVRKIGLSFQGTTARLRNILQENRRTGFPIYVGGLFGVASGQFIALWVVEFSSSSQYGHYALALAIAGPLSAAVSSLGTVIFRSSSKSTSLTPEIGLYALAFGVALWLLYFTITEALLVRAFGPRYEASVRMTQLLGVGSVLAGWGDIFQRFLGSKGEGKRLCFAAMIAGTAGIVSAVILLPRWGVYGAITSFVVSSGIYLASMSALYMKVTQQLCAHGVMGKESVPLAVSDGEKVA